MRTLEKNWEVARDKMELCIDLICERITLSGIHTDWDIREYITLDVLRFLLNICNADGEITDNELAFIKHLFGYNLSQEEWLDYMEKEGLLDANYLKTPPYSLNTVIEVENIENNYISSLSKVYIELLDELGKEAINADNREEDTEHSVRNEYIGFLCSYVDKHLERKWHSQTLKTRVEEDSEQAIKLNYFKKQKATFDLIHQTRKLADSIAAAHPQWEWKDLGKSFLEELKQFLLCLAGADKKITPAEATFLREYLSLEVDSFSLQRLLESGQLDTKSFLQTPPSTFKSFVIHDMDNRSERHCKSKAGAVYISIMELLGESFLLCDGESNKEEVSAYEDFINLLRENYARYVPRACAKKMTLSAELKEAVKKSAKKPATQKLSTESKKTLEELLSELHSLTGLASVKENVTSLIHMQEVQRMRRKRGMKLIPTSNHLVFSGNPGTGKTTVARLIAQLYQKMGVIRRGEIVEVDRSGLVGGYVGQTAIKTQDVINKALGGVLFIDEAYTLTQKGNNDYGQEAVDTLLKAMEDHRDELIVIVAGYPKLMSDFIASNPGLASRFNKYIDFEDYAPEELLEIFVGMCKKNGYKPCEEALTQVQKILEKKYLIRDSNFANAREVRNLFETIVTNQANRLFSIPNPSNEDLATILPDDIIRL